MSSVSYAVLRPGPTFPVQDSGQRRPVRATQQAALPLTGSDPQGRRFHPVSWFSETDRNPARGERRGEDGAWGRRDTPASWGGRTARCWEMPSARASPWTRPGATRPAAPGSQPHGVPPRAAHGVSDRVAVEVHTSRSSLAAQRTHRITAVLRPGLLRHHPLGGKKTSPRSCLQPAKG